MYCKYCGHQIDDDSTFCQFCGKMQVNNAKAIEDGVVTKQEYAIRINGNINVLNNESLFNRIIIFSSKHKYVCSIYALSLVSTNGCSLNPKNYPMEHFPLSANPLNVLCMRMR